LTPSPGQNKPLGRRRTRKSEKGAKKWTAYTVADFSSRLIEETRFLKMG
jgi:hypothetical protein